MGFMWWCVASKNQAMLLTPGKRCTTILTILSIVLLTLVFYWDGARETHIPGKQRSMRQNNVMDKGNTGGTRDSPSLREADSQNVNSLDRDALMVGKFKGGAESYSRTKNDDSLDLKVEDKLKLDLEAANPSKVAHSMTTTITTTSSVHPPTTTISSLTKPKTILFYTKLSWKWVGKLNGHYSKMINCPVSTCVLLENSTHPEEADAVVFHVNDFDPKWVPSRRRPDQLYVWLSLEAPTWSGFGLPRPGRSYKSLGKIPLTRKSFGRPGFFNWTSTYHRESDVMLPYGGLVPLEGE